MDIRVEKTVVARWCHGGGREQGGLSAGTEHILLL
jgi:hypothetical protein